MPLGDVHVDVLPSASQPFESTYQTEGRPQPVAASQIDMPPFTHRPNPSDLFAPPSYTGRSHTGQYRPSCQSHSGQMV